MPKDKIRLSDANTGKMLTIQTATDSLEKDITLIIPSKDSVLVTKEDMEKHIEDVSKVISNIRKPIILSPVQNEVDYDGTITISAYDPSPLFAGSHTNTVIQIARDIDFTDLVFNLELGNVTSYGVNFTEVNTKYYIRVVYKSGPIVSKWSDVVEFTTVNSGLSRPVVSISSDDVNSVDDGAIISIGTFTSIDPSETHVSTTWRVTDPITGITIWESVNDTDNLTSITIERDILSTNTNYLIKVTVNGSINGESPVGNLAIKTLEEFSPAVGGTFPADNNTTIVGSYGGVGYFGAVGVEQLGDNYNYTGPYGLNNPTKVYAKDEQVTYNGVLYRALKASTNVTPGTDATAWEVDTRNGLPTGKWLLDELGIGYGLSDGNVDGKSTGATIGNLKNNDQGWLKYIHSGKLIYIAKKPWVDTIAWTDIAKREAESGKRTIRIGKNLYYIRLIKEAEYVDCILNLTNGNLATIPASDIGATENTWIEDNSTGANRKVMSTSSTPSSISAKSRTGSYRPVLEYIPEGQEPYNNIKTGIPLATAENFQYDFYTDTGYFGHVPSTSLISGNSLATTVGLTSGTAQNDTTGYFKFYWHGILLYVCKQTIRHSVSWNNLDTTNVVFGKDMGGTGLKTISLGTNTYAVQLLLGADKSPSTAATGHNSQWNELIYRVNTYIPKLGDTDIATEGMQIGSNWANYADTEMSITITSGNGYYNWCQEIYSPNTTYRILRGRGRLSLVYAHNSACANTGFGARLVLRVL